MPSHDSVVFHDVRFGYDTSEAPLFGGALRLHLPRGFTGVVGPNGAGKTTLLRLAVGDLAPDAGRVEAPGRAALCAQRTDEPPAALDTLLRSPSPDARRLRDALGLEPQWATRWLALSHGERKRLQIGAALLEAPDLLALDEPTNHVDAATRAALERALRAFPGVGILVSHDRALLDALCARCLFVDPHRAVLRPGGYTDGCREAERERATAAHAREAARRDTERLAREAATRRAEAARSDRRRSKRGLDPRDHDTRARKDLARVTGKDATAGRLLRQLDGRLRQAEEHEASIRVEKVRRLGIWLPGARARRDRLVTLPPGAIPLGDGRTLTIPELGVAPGERIAITGANGAGKSTLVRHLVRACGLPSGRVTAVPQELDVDAARAVRDEVRALPREALGFVMTVVSCLGSRPGPLLASDAPSPGELRKLVLALGMRREPWLLVLDEPTNHLDLPSIECLEDALAASPCALVLVSHDRRFLARLATREWRIASAAPGEAGPGDTRLDVVALSPTEGS